MVQKASLAERLLSMPCCYHCASVFYLGGAYWEFLALTEFALPHAVYEFFRLPPKKACLNHEPYV